MSSRKKKGEGKTGESWEKSEDVLQAVILADSFNYKFSPITREKPRVRLIYFLLELSRVSKSKQIPEYC